MQQCSGLHAVQDSLDSCGLVSLHASLCKPSHLKCSAHRIFLWTHTRTPPQSQSYFVTRRGGPPLWEWSKHLLRLSQSNQWCLLQKWRELARCGTKAYLLTVENHLGTRTMGRAVGRVAPDIQVELPLGKWFDWFCLSRCLLHSQRGPSSSDEVRL